MHETLVYCYICLTVDRFPTCASVIVQEQNVWVGTTLLFLILLKKTKSFKGTLLKSRLAYIDQGAAFEWRTHHSRAASAIDIVLDCTCSTQHTSQLFYQSWTFLCLIGIFQLCECSALAFCCVSVIGPTVLNIAARKKKYLRKKLVAEHYCAKNKNLFKKNVYQKRPGLYAVKNVPTSADRMTNFSVTNVQFVARPISTFH